MDTKHSLENTIEKNSFIKQAFKEEWPTMPNHLIACGVAIGTSTGFSYFAPSFMNSDAAISGIATALDATGYWFSFLPQLLYRDRNKIKNESGHIDKKKALKKAGEYLSYIGILEGAYSIGRFAGQYYLQKKGWDPATASLAIQTSATAFFTLAWPLIRYKSRQWSEK